MPFFLHLKYIVKFYFNILQFYYVYSVYRLLCLGSTRVDSTTKYSKTALELFYMHTVPPLPSISLNILFSHLYSYKLITLQQNLRLVQIESICKQQNKCKQKMKFGLGRIENMWEKEKILVTSKEETSFSIS